MRWLLPDARGLPRAYWWLFGATLFDRLGGFAGVYLALYLTGRGGLSLSVAGVVASMQAIGGLLGTPLSGALADRFGRRPLILWGFALTALAWLHVAVAQGPVHIGLAVFLAGLAGAVGRPAMSAAIADVVPEPDRRRAFAAQYWAVNLGFACAASLAGWVAQVEWWLVFVGDAATSLLVAGALFFGLPALPAPEASPRPDAVSPRPPLTAALAPLRDARFRRLLFASVGTSAVFMQVGVTLAAELRRDGLEGDYGWLVGLNGVFIVALQPLLVRATARFDVVDVLSAGCAVMGAGFFATQLCDAAWSHALAIAVWTVGEILCASANPVLVTRLAPPDQRATYQGLFQASWSAAALSPALGAWAMDQLGPAAVWTTCLVVGLACAWGVRALRAR